MYFKIEENRFFFNGNENSVWIEKVDSLLSCSQMCARREDCQSANFIKGQRKCSLFSEGRSGYLTGLLIRDGCFYMEKVGKGRLHTNEFSLAGSCLVSRVGAGVRALASRQCGSGSIPGLGVICGLSLLLVLFLALRGFSSGSLVFPLSTKTNISKFQFDQEPEGHSFVNRNRLLSVTLVINKVYLFYFILTT